MNRLIRTYQRYLGFMMRQKFLRRILWVAVLFLSIPVMWIDVENNLEEWMPDDAGITESRNRFISDFGHDEWMFCYMKLPDGIAVKERHHLMSRATDSLRSIEGVHRVFSSADLLQIWPFLPEANRPGVDSVRQMYFDGKDAYGELIYIQQSAADHPDAERPAILREIERKLAFQDEGVSIHLAGSGVIFTEIDRLTSEDAALLLGGAVLLMVVLLGLRIGSWRRFRMLGILLLLTYLPALSLFGWLGAGMNMVTMVVPVLLLILFVAYLLHLTSHTSYPVGRYLSLKSVPVILAGITTVIGIGSLMISEFPIIREFGMLTAGGLLIGLSILLLLGIPEILSSPSNDEKSVRSRFDTMLNKGLANYYGRLTRGRALIISAVTGVIAVAGIYVFPGIEVDTNTISFLHEDNPVRQDVGFIQESFGSVNPVDILLTKPDGEWEESDWERVRGLRRELEALNFVDAVIGYDGWYGIGEEQVLEEVRPQYVSADGKRTRLMARIPMGPAGQMENQADRIMEEVDSFALQHGYKAEPAGYLPVYLYQMNNIVRGMLNSLGLALILIMLVIMLIVRNARLALLSIFPNVFPLLCLSAIMYWVGIPLDISTSVIACVVIGIVVDDCLHILWYYQRGHLINYSSTGALFKGSVLPYIRPITNSTLIFGAGFLVLLFSGLQPIAYMGFLCSLALFIAWFSDVILFPALLSIGGMKGGTAGGFRGQRAAYFSPATREK